MRPARATKIAANVCIYAFFILIISAGVFAICGNNIKETGESCDDGNTLTGDGCSSFCELEPDCSSGSCQTICGDGIKLPTDPHECDDGNLINGDGCSSTCRIESGFVCVDAVVQAPNTLTLPVVSRDFISRPRTSASTRHPDFEIFSGDDVTRGLVQPTLVSGQPVASGNCMVSGTSVACPYGQQLTSAANFNQWYRNVAGVNVQKVSNITLTKQPNGNYIYSNNTYFPVDNFGWVASNNETTGLSYNVAHNFGFTNEIKYWFTYTGNEYLQFNGDDDVWVFINNKLAVDVGGLHPVRSRNITLNSSVAAQLNLTIGNVYELDFFHAERRTNYSNFYLTIRGFNSATSTCSPIISEEILDISDRSISFTNTSFPRYTYDLKNMIDTWNSSMCPASELVFNVSNAFNYVISGPDANGIINITPVDWNFSQSETLEVEISCKNLGTVNVTERTYTGSADIVLITDFSGSMKKNVLFNDEQGSGQSDCTLVYSDTTPRLSALARCIDIDFVTEIMSIEGNRIWPVYFWQDKITPYTGDPTNPGSIIAGVTPSQQGAGQTCLACAVNAGYNIFNANNDPTRKRYVVMMTDGWPTHCASDGCTGVQIQPQNSAICAGYCDFQGSCGATNNLSCTTTACNQPVSNTINSANRTITAFGTKIFTVGFGVVDTCALTQNLLGTIATSSGGNYYASRDPEQLRQFYLDIARDIIEETITESEVVTKYRVRDAANLTIIYTAPEVPQNTIDLVNTTLAFNYSSYPGHIYNLSNMISNMAALSCSQFTYAITNTLTNFTYQGPDTSNGTTNISPNYNWLIDTDEYFRVNATCIQSNGSRSSDVASLHVIYTKQSLPQNTIDLVNTTLTFNYSSYPGHIYNLSNMISNIPALSCAQITYAITNTLINFTYQGPTTNNGTSNISPNYSWLVDTDEYFRVNATCIQNNGSRSSDVALLHVIYDEETIPSCGNGIKELLEQCDDGANNGNGYCSNLCTFSELDIRDTTISFNYTSYPQHQYNLTNMLNPAAVMFCTSPTYRIMGSTTNFSITAPSGAEQTIGIAPTYSTMPWFASTEETVRVNISCTESIPVFNPYTGQTTFVNQYFEDISNLRIVYLAQDLPPSDIDCLAIADQYVGQGDTKTVTFDQIFSAPSFVTTTVTASFPSGITGIVDQPTEKITFSADQRVDDEIEVTITPNYGNIQTCRIPVWSLYTNCELDACDGLDSYNDLRAQGCLDGEIAVYTPFTPKRSQDLFGTNRGFSYAAVAYDDFTVTPANGDQFSVLRFSNATNLSFGSMGATRITGTFQGATIPLCLGLRRIDFTIGEESYDANSTLLITSSKSISGFFQLDGDTFSKGPFTFIVKAWLRK
ncbi:MAG TPA: fibro-slime domain-containing protein [Acidobacteriota bacterium]|nr:fibro-slime domain-containing protein [Acidobacteriota bacterium]